LKDLNRIKDALINPQVLKQGGLIKDKDKPVKILGEGELKQAFSVQAHAFSKKAQQAITTGGGKAEIIHV
jgi:large subunit ribosomal protein L15